MAKYNNPNPSRKRVSNINLGPTQTKIDQVDPKAVAGVTPGSEFGTLSMGRPGQINFGKVC